MRAALYWAPRIPAIVFGLFVSLFAMDSFHDHDGIVRQLITHLIPVAIYAAVLVVAWRWEWVGALLLAALGVLYVAFVGGQRLDWNLVIAGPLFLLAALFLAGGWLRRARRPH